MAQAAQAQNPPQAAPLDKLEFVQLKDGSYAWLNSDTGELTPAVRQPEWNRLFALLEEYGPAEPEFMQGVEDPPLEDEEIF